MAKMEEGSNLLQKRERYTWLLDFFSSTGAVYFIFAYEM